MSKNYNDYEDFYGDGNYGSGGKRGSGIAKTIALITALVLLFAGMFTSLYMIFFHKEKTDTEDPVEKTQESVLNNGGMIASNTVENGIKLMSAKVTPIYSPLKSSGNKEAESTYKLTATVTPEDAYDRSLNWSVAFVNPESAWAKGKTVTDYVNVVPTSNGALTATVSCYKAFGEQIKVIATSVSNPEASAHCVFDYSKKITGISLSFGNVSCVEDGITEYVLELNEDETAQGGEISFTPTYSSTYTIDDTFTFAGFGSDSKIMFSFMNGYIALDAEQFAMDLGFNDELYFDVNFMEATQMSYTMEGQTIMFAKNIDVAEDFLNVMKESDAFGIELHLTYSGRYSIYDYVTTLVMSDFVYTSNVKNVNFNKTSYVF